MSQPITRSRYDVMADQQDAVRYLESRGVNRKTVAHMLGVSASAINQMMAGSDYRFSTELHEALMQLAFEWGYRAYFDRRLAGYLMVPVPAVEPDGRTDDEVLDAVESVGHIRIQTLVGNASAIEEHGYRLIVVGQRTVMEARRMQDRPAAPLYALPVPLFEMGDGSAATVAL